MAISYEDLQERLGGMYSRAPRRAAIQEYLEQPYTKTYGQYKGDVWGSGSFGVPGISSYANVWGTAPSGNISQLQNQQFYQAGGSLPDYAIDPSGGLGYIPDYYSSYVAGGGTRDPFTQQDITREANIYGQRQRQKGQFQERGDARKSAYVDYLRGSVY